ncbi:MAG: fructosamine kinase family protein [Nocardioidaceae bacterium]|nr:fructosamine kinase family protein [Nocardioidaceae bacterium]
MGTLAARAEQLLGRSVVATAPVPGGDTCTATRRRLSDGRSALMTTRPHSPPGFFAVEARGLGWLAEAHGAPVPEVLAVDDDCLVVAWVETGRATGEAAEQLGRDLARTHAAGAARLGADTDGFIGSAPLPNTSADTWPDFYATCRVEPYLRVAVERQAIEPADVAAVNALLDRLGELAGPAEPVARLHGDLWAGNLLWSATDTVHVVDPAAHGGHRETDLAMLALFGAPHLDRVLEAYDEAAPLADGWRARVPLHQLHPLLVHAARFGGSYGARAGSAARAALEPRAHG